MRIIFLYSVFILLLTALTARANAASDDQTPFNDAILEEALLYPDWFELSSGSLSDDLANARAAGKKGIIVYYGQERCAYCEQFINRTLGETDISAYLQRYYDMIPIDIWGIETISDTDGNRYSERELSLAYETNFTPSLVFYNDKGKPVFRLRGYYPPYRFNAALKYVTEGFYKVESYRDYLDRAQPELFFKLGGLIEREFFSQPPYQLNKARGKILAVFFEQGNCHSCDLLHSGPLSKKDVLDEMEKLQAVQLDMWADTEVITPAGRKTTAKEWAADLKLFNAPSILFFDETGEEILRIDSVIEFYRLWGVLNYVNSGGYKLEPNFQEWRLSQRKLR